jgi:predicted AAA+ superfamily ATPase
MPRGVPKSGFRMTKKKMVSLSGVVNVKSVEVVVESRFSINERFGFVSDMVCMLATGDQASVIVTGPGGLGKTFNVIKALEKSGLKDISNLQEFEIDSRINLRKSFVVIKGYSTPKGLYRALYENRNGVIVFDDCDSVFSDELSLNILKAALDSGKRRKICWNSDSSLLRREGIPDSFDFDGSAIFITNLKFSNVKSKKLQDHLAALQSRCHFLDLTIDNQRDKMLRIKQVHRDADGGLFKDYEFDSNESQVIIDFMFENQTKLREISMRMCLKIADLVKISPDNWRNLAVNTCMKE